MHTNYVVSGIAAMHKFDTRTGAAAVQQHMHTATDTRQRHNQATKLMLPNKKGPSSVMAKSVRFRAGFFPQLEVSRGNLCLLIAWISPL